MKAEPKEELVPITITLTRKQWSMLEECLMDYQDEGPSPEGWKSPEFSDIESTINEAINNTP